MFRLSLARWWPLLGLILLLPGIYAPALLTSYGHTDDFITLRSSGEQDLAACDSWMMGLGRPLTALVTDYCFTLAGTIDALAAIRAVGLIGVLLFVVCVERFLARRDWAAAERFAVALILGCLPGVAMYVLWSVCFPYAYAAALGFAGGWLALVPPARRRSVWLRYLGGWALVLVSLLIYQPAALFGVLPALLGVWKRTESPDRASYQAAFAALLTLAAGLGSYFVFYRLALVTLLTFPGGRSELNMDFFARGVYLWREVIPDLFYVWSYFLGENIRKAIAAVVVLVLGAGVLRVALQDWKRVLLSGGVVVGAIGLALVPAALPAEAYAPYRVTGPLQAIVWIGGCVAFGGLARLWTPRAAGGIAVLAVIFGIAAFAVSQRFFVEPNARELAKARAAIAPLERYPEHLIFVKPGNPVAAGIDLPIAKWQFALPSGHASWYAPGIFPLLLEEKFGCLENEPLAKSRNRVEIIQVWSSFDGPVQGIPVVDFYPDKSNWRPQPEGPFSTIPLPDQFRPIDDSYRLSPWLGFIKVKGQSETNTWLHHPRLGSIAYRVDGGQLWLNLHQLGWVMTNEELFPWVWRKSDDTWFQIDFSDPGNVRLIPKAKSTKIAEVGAGLTR